MLLVAIFNTLGQSVLNVLGTPVFVSYDSAVEFASTAVESSVFTSLEQNYEMKWFRQLTMAVNLA